MSDFNAWEIARIDLDQRIPGASGVWYRRSRRHDGEAFLGLAMVLLLVAAFLSCAALVGFAGRVIGSQGQVGHGDGVGYGALCINGVTGLSGDYLFYAVIHPERF